jgi:predicted dehydrogenase
MDDVHLGFVGAGFMGQLAHLANYDRLDGCSVVALAEPQRKLAERVATRYEIPSVYDEHKAMVEDVKVDAIVAAQPFARYVHIVPDLLEAGIPLFTEKPAAMTPESAQNLAALANNADVPHMVGYHKRSDPAMECAKALVDDWKESGAYGDLRYVRATMPEGNWKAGVPAPITTDESPPESEMESPPDEFDDNIGEVYFQFVNYYIHQINTLRFFFGEPYSVTYADAEETLLIGESDSGVAGTIELSPYQTSMDWQESILVGFEHGYIRIDLPAPLQRQTAGTVEVMHDERDSEQRTLAPTMPPKSAMRSQAENFLAVVRGKRDPPCDISEAATDLRVAYQYVRERYDC